MRFVSVPPVFWQSLSLGTCLECTDFRERGRRETVEYVFALCLRHETREAVVSEGWAFADALRDARLTE